MNNTQISIIIPTYNRAEILKKVLPSYFTQKHLVEIIIVDDGSTDETEVLIKTFQKQHPNLKYVKHKNNKGLPSARNTGIKHAAGDYVLFGEDDVVFDPGYAEQLSKCLERHPKAGAAAGRIIYLKSDENQNDALKRTKNKKGPLIDKHMLAPKFDVDITEDTLMPYVHACALVKKDVFDKVLFDEEYKVNAAREETDFFINVNKAAYEVYLCPHTTCFHLPRTKSGGGSWETGIFKYQWRMIKNNYRFIKKHYVFLKKNPGLKNGKIKFMFLQIMNRIRHLFLYFSKAK